MYTYNISNVRAPVLTQHTISNLRQSIATQHSLVSEWKKETFLPYKICLVQWRNEFEK